MHALRSCYRRDLFFRILNIQRLSRRSVSTSSGKGIGAIRQPNSVSCKVDERASFDVQDGRPPATLQSPTEAVPKIDRVLDGENHARTKVCHNMSWPEGIGS